MTMLRNLTELALVEEFCARREHQQMAVCAVSGDPV